MRDEAGMKDFFDGVAAIIEQARTYVGRTADYWMKMEVFMA